jgi:hypothetical protein
MCAANGFFFDHFFKPTCACHGATATVCCVGCELWVGVGVGVAGLQMGLGGARLCASVWSPRSGEFCHMFCPRVRPLFVCWLFAPLNVV